MSGNITLDYILNSEAIIVMWGRHYTGRPRPIDAPRAVQAAAAPALMARVIAAHAASLLAGHIGP